MTNALAAWVQGMTQERYATPATRQEALAQLQLALLESSVTDDHEAVLHRLRPMMDHPFDEVLFECLLDVCDCIDDNGECVVQSGIFAELVKYVSAPAAAPCLRPALDLMCLIMRRVESRVMAEMAAICRRTPLIADARALELLAAGVVGQINAELYDDAGSSLVQLLVDAWGSPVAAALVAKGVVPKLLNAIDNTAVFVPHALASIIRAFPDAAFEALEHKAVARFSTVGVSVNSFRWEGADDVVQAVLACPGTASVVAASESVGDLTRVFCTAGRAHVLLEAPRFVPALVRDLANAGNWETPASLAAMVALCGEPAERGEQAARRLAAAGCVKVLARVREDSPCYAEAVALKRTLEQYTGAGAGAVDDHEAKRQKRDAAE